MFFIQYITHNECFTKKKKIIIYKLFKRQSYDLKCKRFTQNIGRTTINLCKIT